MSTSTTLINPAPRQKYTHIQSHGTPSAFEPRQIAHSLTSGKENTPFNVIDANVTFSVAGTNDWILGPPISSFSGFVSLSLNAHQSILPGSGDFYQVVMGRETVKDGGINVYTVISASYGSTAPVSPPTVPTTGVQSGIVETAITNKVIAEFYDVNKVLCPWYPILRKLGAVDTSGTINVKIVSFSP
jgi:hypothetical protein